MKDKIVLSLFDYSTNMVKPWALNGYECYCIDTKHEGHEVIDIETGGKIHKIEADILEYLPPLENYKIVFAFPPCKNLAVSGARWFKDKGLSGLSEGLKLVEKSHQIAQWTDSTWMIENPRSTLSTYWREPNYTFQPHQYNNFTNEDNNYTKLTCLWTSKDFIMPEPGKSDINKRDYKKVHLMNPEKRENEGTFTPMGFANAVYEVNK